MKANNHKKCLKNIWPMKMLYSIAVAASISMYYGELESWKSVVAWGHIYLEKIFPNFLKNSLNFYEEFLAFAATLGVLIIGFCFPLQRIITLLFVVMLALFAYLPFYGSYIIDILNMDNMSFFYYIKVFLWLNGMIFFVLAFVPTSACTFSVWLWRLYERKNTSNSLTMALCTTGVYLLSFGGICILWLIVVGGLELGLKWIADSWTIRLCITLGILSLLFSAIWRSQKKKYLVHKK